MVILFIFFILLLFVAPRWSFIAIFTIVGTAGILTLIATLATLAKTASAILGA